MRPTESIRFVCQLSVDLLLWDLLWGGVGLKFCVRVDRNSTTCG